MYNNTCKWLTQDEHDTLKVGMPYVMLVTAENRLGSAMSETHRVETKLIGT